MRQTFAGQRTQTIEAFKVILNSATVCAEHLESIYRINEEKIIEQNTGKTYAWSGPGDQHGSGKTTREHGIQEAKKIIDAQSEIVRKLKAYQEFFTPYLDISSNNPAIKEKQDLIYRSIIAWEEMALYVEKYPLMSSRFKNSDYEIHCRERWLGELPKDIHAGALITLKDLATRSLNCAAYSVTHHQNNRGQMIEDQSSKAEGLPGRRLLNLQAGTEDKVDALIREQVDFLKKIKSHHDFIVPFVQNVQAFRP
jgi:hypothetical protein